ncbi:MAG TPA: hypothetical protein VGR08_08785 [Thermomicrobiales bacterium]|nr:hypothetical protein [Thermomicrobiales bacterium]
MQRNDGPAALADVADAFLSQALALDPDLDGTLHDVLTAATLLRLAGIHITRPAGYRIAPGSSSNAPSCSMSLTPWDNRDRSGHSRTALPNPSPQCGVQPVARLAARSLE